MSITTVLTPPIAERARDEATAHVTALSKVGRMPNGDQYITDQRKHKVTEAQYDAALQARAEAQQAAEVARLRWNEVNMAVTAASQARRAAVSRAEAQAAAATARGRHAGGLRQRLGIGR